MQISDCLLKNVARNDVAVVKQPLKKTVYKKQLANIVDKKNNNAKSDGQSPTHEETYVSGHIYPA